MSSKGLNGHSRNVFGGTEGSDAALWGLSDVHKGLRSVPAERTSSIGSVYLGGKTFSSLMKKW